MAPVTGRMPLAVYGNLTGPVWICEVALYRAKQKPAHESEDRLCDALPTKLANRSEVIRIKRSALTQQLVVLAVSGVGTTFAKGRDVETGRGRGGQVLMSVTVHAVPQDGCRAGWGRRQRLQILPDAGAGNGLGIRLAKPKIVPNLLVRQAEQPAPEVI